MGLVSFAAVMIVLNVAAFLVRAEPAAEAGGATAAKACPLAGAA
jgi:hypothetical protein